MWIGNDKDQHEKTGQFFKDQYVNVPKVPPKGTFAVLDLMHE
jgi:hypothetical protein